MDNAIDALDPVNYILKKSASIHNDSKEVLNELEKLELIAASIAHEIKNPLSLISATLQLLELKTDLKSNSSFKLIDEELSKINNLIEMFLEITRPFEYSFELINVFDFLEKNLQAFLPLFLSNNIQFVRHYTSNAKLLCDPLYIQSVFSNALKNSMEAFTENSEKILQIFVYEYNQHFCVEITDNGCGISSENMEKIYNPFFTTKKTGSGIGVYISDKIMKDHNGKYAINSVENIGCSVVLKFKANYVLI